jgi:YidC/Oxa1 family membrane protein insertase
MSEGSKGGLGGIDRNTIIRWALIAVALILLWKFGIPKACGDGKTQSLPAETYVSAPDFVPDAVDPPVGEGPNKPVEGQLCKIEGPRYDAELSTRGAALVHMRMHDPQYSVPGDMSTTPDHERWRNLRTTFRGEGANDQVKYDRFNWNLERIPNNKGCIFTYADDTVKIVKTVVPTERPFELAVETSITNLADARKKHQLTIGMFAFRRLSEVKGSLGRVSPFQTELSCAKQKDVTRKAKDDFKEGWYAEADVNRYASINNNYFTQALMLDGGTATCSVVAEDWLAPGQAKDDDNAASVYHALLTYPVKELGKNESATYKDFAYLGPKERPLLAKAGGGVPGLGDTIYLGWFAPVARVLVTILNFFHDKIAFGNWGLAIILMTIGIRVVLFPLQYKSIKSSLEMRKLRPDLDDLNKKFPDDAQARNLAMMELYKKKGVNPLGGCLPQLVQMPVWFAMYTTLQTAVEMYHTKFLWFADLSAPDKYYIQPAILGAMMFLQQRLMPPQPGMDPMQQKMMNYLMPVIFIVMMLFLPAALGLYSMTNSFLFITQTLVVERIAARMGVPSRPAKTDSKKTAKKDEPPPSKDGGGKLKAKPQEG